MRFDRISSIYPENILLTRHRSANTILLVPKHVHKHADRSNGELRSSERRRPNSPAHVCGLHTLTHKSIMLERGARWRRKNPGKSARRRLCAKTASRIVYAVVACVYMFHTFSSERLNGEDGGRRKKKRIRHFARRNTNTAAMHTQLERRRVNCFRSSSSRRRVVVCRHTGRAFVIEPSIGSMIDGLCTHTRSRVLCFARALCTRACRLTLI